MKAIQISGLGGLDVLVSADVETPTPGPNDVLVNVKAVSINPVEAKIRAGKWAGGNLPPGTILGFDGAGIVHSLGSNVPPNHFKPGDEVWFLGSTVPTHSNAEYVLIDHRALSLKPKSISFEDAAGIPLVGLTAWEMLVEQMNISDDGVILVINGAGGVGSVATQLARNVCGMKTVIATASREISINHTKSLGATHVITHREPLAPQIKALNLGLPIKYIAVFTTTTKDVLDQCLEVISPGGKIGLAVQGPPGSFDGFGSFQRKSVNFQWTFVFTKMALDWQLETQGKALAIMAQLMDEKKLKPITTKALDLTLAGLMEAHQLMENAETIGKVVLRVPEVGGFQ